MNNFPVDKDPMPAWEGWAMVILFAIILFVIVRAL